MMQIHSHKLCQHALAALVGLLGLAGACGDGGSQEKVDAGQRKYCDAYCPDGASDRDGSRDVHLSRAVDSATFPEAGVGGPDLPAGLDSVLDGSAEGPKRDAWVLRLDTAGSDGAPGVDASAGRANDAPADRADAAIDMRSDAPDGGSDARDGRADATDLAVDGAAERAADALDGAGDVAGDAGADLGADGTEVAPIDVPADAPADVPPEAGPELPPSTCGLGAGGWSKAWGAKQGFQGLGLSADGAPWVLGNVYEAYDFGTGTLFPNRDPLANDPDVFLLKLDPSSHAVTAAFGFNNLGATPQEGRGVAVAMNGNVAMIGSFTGEIDFTADTSEGDGASGVVGTAGLHYLLSSATVAFYGVFDGTSPGTCATPVGTCIRPIKAHKVDVGNGGLLAIASNPSQAAFAICGKTSKATPAWGTGSGSSAGVINPGSATHGGGMDIVVAKIDAATGAVVWGRQFGGGADQVCDSVALANNGDVVIAGNYTGTLDFGGTLSLPAVADTTAGLLYVAVLSAADGTPVAAASWGGSGRNNAYGVAVAPDGAIVVVGSLSGNVDFGAGVATAWTGLTDAFALKLTSSLAPVWARSFGDADYDQSARSLGLSSTGDVFLGGSFKGTLGALGLTSSSNTALDAYVAQLRATDGTPVCARRFGDADGAQDITSVSVARTASGTLTDAVMVGGSFSSALEIGGSTWNAPSTAKAGYVARIAP
jgi:hypothetical protein